MILLFRNVCSGGIYEGVFINIVFFKKNLNNYKIGLKYMEYRIIDLKFM